MKAVIGLAGHKRNGKDALGRILVERFGYTRAAFADKIRELALAVDPVLNVDNDDRLWRLSDVVAEYGWELAKDGDPEVRRILDQLGVGVRQVIGADTWVDVALREIPDGAHVVFTDVRFPNEAEAIKRAGGEVWRIVRPGYEAPADASIVETSLNDWPFDVIVPNAGDLDDLAVIADHYLNRKRVRAWSV